MKRLLLLCVVLSIWLTGCGVSSTDGTLSDVTIVPTPNGGTYNIKASATYVPSGGSAPNGVPMGFSWSSPAGSSSATSYLGSDGIGSVSFSVPQTSATYSITVTATVGDLSKSSSVAISPFIAFSVSPTTLTFPIATTVLTQTITTAGTYTLSSATSDSANIVATFSGNTVTVTDKSSTAATGTTPLSATITLTDTNAKVITVPVTYY